MYTLEEQRFCLIQTKSELYSICNNFYNSAGKYVVIGRMNDIILAISYHEFFF